MTEARDVILAAVERSSTEYAEVLEARLGCPPQHPSPRLPTETAQRVGHFMQQLDGLGVEVTRLESLTHLPEHVQAVAEQFGLASFSHCLGRGLNLPGAPNSGQETPLLVSGVDLAVAETGSLLIACDEPAQTRALFLAERHLAVVREEQVVASLEHAWHWLRGRDQRPLRSHFITGPSKTADVEQTLVVGAHGPIALQVTLIAQVNRR